MVQIHSLGAVVALTTLACGPGTGSTRSVRELGCWIIIEHDAFATLQVQRDAAARFLRAHGGPHHVPKVSPRRRHTVQFDCVVRGTVTGAAAPSYRESNVATFATP